MYELTGKKNEIADLIKWRSAQIKRVLEALSKDDLFMAMQAYTEMDSFDLITKLSHDFEYNIEQ